MLSFSRPHDDVVRAALKKAKAGEPSYGPRGATRDAPPGPPDYLLDHNPIQLGQGSECFERAKQAVREWRMFDFPWIEVRYPDADYPPVRVGVDVGVLARPFYAPIYFLNMARVIYVQDGPPPATDAASDVKEVFGFAYGTLDDHVETGEERFTVELREDDSVWYNLLAFSRPNKWYVRLGYPVTRYLQKRFARASKAAMLRAVV